MCLAPQQTPPSAEWAQKLEIQTQGLLNTLLKVKMFGNQRQIP